MPGRQMASLAQVSRLASVIGQEPDELERFFGVTAVFPDNQAHPADKLLYLDGTDHHFAGSMISRLA
jgi:hypothetical protein